VGQGFRLTFPRYSYNGILMTKITPLQRERIKANICYTKKAGHKKMAIDLALHVLLADTLQYIKLQEGLDKPKK